MRDNGVRGVVFVDTYDLALLSGETYGSRCPLSSPEAGGAGGEGGESE